MFSISMGLVVTCKQKYQCVESLAVRNKRYLSDGDEPLLVDKFANNNYFYAALHTGVIPGVAHEDDK